MDIILWEYSLFLYLQTRANLTDNESQVFQTHPSVSGSPHQLTEFHLCTSDVCDSEVLPLEATPVSEEYEVWF